MDALPAPEAQTYRAAGRRQRVACCPCLQASRLGRREGSHVAGGGTDALPPVRVFQQEHARRRRDTAGREKGGRRASASPNIAAPDGIVRLSAYVSRPRPRQHAICEVVAPPREPVACRQAAVTQTRRRLSTPPAPLSFSSSAWRRRPR